MALPQLILWLRQLRVQPLLGKLLQLQTEHGQAHQRQLLLINGLEVLVLPLVAQLLQHMFWLQGILDLVFFAG
jgi:hypothetical protein